MALVMPEDEFEAVKRVAGAVLTRHDDHDPELACRPAGHELCYPVPAGEQLIPWREALGSDGGDR